MGSPRQDGGWGWIIAGGSLLIGVIVDGVKYSFGLLFIELLDTFRTSKSDTSWIISIQVGVSYFTGPLTGALVNRFGCRKVAMVGTMLSFVGFVISPFATSVYYLYISFGILGGLGFGMMMLPFCVTVVRYFDKYLAFATGISAMGPGLGTIIFNPLTKALIDRYTWRGTLLVEAGLVLNGLVCAAILRQPAGQIEYSVDTDHTNCNDTDQPDIDADESYAAQSLLDVTERENGLRGTGAPCERRYDEVKSRKAGDLKEDNPLAGSLLALHEYQCGSHSNINTSKPSNTIRPNKPTDSNESRGWITLTPLRNPGFLILMASTILVELSLIVPFSYLPDMMVMQGYSRPNAVWIIFIIGICSTISRVFAGAIADLKCVNRVILCIVCIIATGVTTAFFPLCQNYTSFVVLSVAFGISAGSSCSLRGILIPDLFGVETIADCIGISMFFSGAAAFISLPLAGFVTDLSGSYSLSFIVAGIEMVVGGLVIGIIPCLKDRNIER